MEFVHVELKRENWIKPDTQIKNKNEAVEVIRNLIEKRDKEMLISINLATSGQVINASICSIGTVNYSLVSVAEILRLAIMSGGASVILIHNHPSGNPEPSSQDIEITNKVTIACRLMDLELLDHIIIGKDGSYYSIQENHPEQFIVSLDNYKQLFVADGNKLNEK